MNPTFYNTEYIKFSNSFPVSLTFSQRLPFEQIIPLQKYYSEKLGYEVKILHSIESKENQFSYRFLHSDSVYYINDYSRTKLSYDDNIEIIGLWNGNNIAELTIMISNFILNKDGVEAILFEKIRNIVSLKSRRYSNSLVKKYGLSLNILNNDSRKTGTKAYYFTDNSGRSLISSRSYDYLAMSEKDIFNIFNYIYLNSWDEEIEESVCCHAFGDDFFEYTKKDIDDLLQGKNSSIIQDDIQNNIWLKRDLIKIIKDGYYKIESSDLFNSLGVSIYQANELFQECMTENLLYDPYDEKKSYNPPCPLRYVFPTETGITLSLKSKVKRMNRKKIDILLETLLGRVEEYNKIDFMKYSIANVYIFGSFLNKSKSDFGDLDTCIVLKENKLDKVNVEFVEDEIMARCNKAITYCKENGLSYIPPKPRDSLFSILNWDEEIPLKMVKRRNSRISLHPAFDLASLKNQNILEVYNHAKGGIIKHRLMTNKELSKKAGLVVE